MVGTTKVRAIEIRDLRFSFRKKSEDLIHIEFQEIPNGLTLIVGPNGAGKSTLLSLIAGVRKATQGTIRVAPHPGSDSVVPFVGYVPQTPVAVQRLTAEKQLELVAWMQKIPREFVTKKINELIHTVGLEESRFELSSKLSGGQLTRLGIAQALLRENGALLLDESIHSLDPIEQNRIIGVLTKLATSRPVVITSHDLSLLDRVDQVCVMNKGKIRWSGTRDEYRAHVGTDIEIYELLLGSATH